MGDSKPAYRHSMTYTLGQAAKATGVSKPSIAAAIKNGRISAAKDDLGRFMIDPAELHRVYPPASKHPESDTRKPDESKQEGSSKIRELEGRLQALERLLREVTEGRSAAREEAADWKREAEHWRMLLPSYAAAPKPSDRADPPPVIVMPPQPLEPVAQKSEPAPTPNRGSFFGRIFGRAAA
jgi:hypothetical protein